MNSSGRRRLVVLTLAALLASAGGAEASFVQEPGSPIDVGVRPGTLLTTDFNADGRPDLLSVEETTASVLLRGANNYALEAGSPRTVGAGPSGAAIADFNNDSRPDVAISNFVDQNVVVLRRLAGGGFAAGNAFGSPYDLGFRPGAIAAGEFTGDGLTDLAVTNWDGSGVKILRRSGTGFVIQASTPPTGTNPRYIATADFDGVGGTDLAITNAGSSSVTILLRQGTTFLQEAGSPIPVGPSPQRILARDFNGDGRPDLAIANHGEDKLRLLLRQPAGAFGIDSGDFNSDGLPDVVVSNQNGSTASVLLRTADGSFTPDPSSPVATDTGATGVAVADVDADTRPDIAVGNYTDSSVTILLNSTPFPPPPNLDLDGDGVQRPSDCDDNNPAIRPGATDVPGDGVDQDCNGADAPYPLLQRRITAFLSTYPQGYTIFDSMLVKPIRAGDKVRLTCRGGGCPLRKKVIRVKKNRKKLSLLRHLKGARLRKGAKVQLRVTRPATIGRVGTWKIRAPKNVRIAYRCIAPGAKKLSKCPEG